MDNTTCELVTELKAITNAQLRSAIQKNVRKIKENLKELHDVSNEGLNLFEENVRLKEQIKILELEREIDKELMQLLYKKFGKANGFSTRKQFRKGFVFSQNTVTSSCSITCQKMPEFKAIPENCKEKKCNKSDKVRNEAAVMKPASPCFDEELIDVPVKLPNEIEVPFYELGSLGLVPSNTNGTLKSKRSSSASNSRRSSDASNSRRSSDDSNRRRSRDSSISRLSNGVSNSIRPFSASPKSLDRVSSEHTSAYSADITTIKILSELQLMRKYDVIKNHY